MTLIREAGTKTVHRAVHLTEGSILTATATVACGLVLYGAARPSAGPCFDTICQIPAEDETLCEACERAKKR